MNKKTKIAILGVIALVLVTIGITYAYWLITRTQEGENVITTGCLDISLSGENDITLSDQFPISDEEGMHLTPYTFTVTNNCSTSVDYHINLESIGTESTAIDSAAIKAVLNENTPKVLYDYVGADTTISDAYEAYTLGYGTLTAKDTDGSTASYELRLWIDEEAPISEMNKTYTSKISVMIGQGISSQGTNLSSLILADAETNGYLKTETPDFSTVTADGEYGLYSAADDLGTSYYFRGDAENNYVKFGLYQDVFQPSNVDLSDYESEMGSETVELLEEVVSSTGFTSEKECIEYVSGVGLSTCTKSKDIEKIYVSIYDNASVLSSLFFTTEEGCLKSFELDGYTGTCLENSVEKIYKNIYWRIIRINGDGTIRLVYDGTELVANGTAHTSSIASPVYNTDATQIGYTYDVDGTETDSIIKGVVDAWYEDNLKEDYGKYIADSVFCNDRDVAVVFENIQYYGLFDRLYNLGQPTLTCTRDSDKYTVSKTKGNGLLSNPVGLITGDEVVMAGGIYFSHLENSDTATNNTYYLFSNNYYWTMSPFSFGSSSNLVTVGMVDELGALEEKNVDGLNVGARPVINIKADVLFEGNGTIDTPYEIAS